jgi:hypothetical protein
VAEVSVDVERVISASALDFRELVWPRFAAALGGGSLVPVESVTDSAFAKLLDTQAGIDAWQVVGTGGLRGVASRVQWGGTCWDSWTVRTQRVSGARTERDKLIDPDFTLIRPSYHIQAYVDGRGGRLLAAACIRTNDLVRMVLGGLVGPERTNPVDGARFVPVWWDAAEQEGFQVWRA